MTMREQPNVAGLDATNSLDGLTPDAVDALFAPVVRATRPCDLCDGSATDARGDVCPGCEGAGEVPT